MEKARNLQHPVKRNGQNAQRCYTKCTAVISDTCSWFWPPFQSLFTAGIQDRTPPPPPPPTHDTVSVSLTSKGLWDTQKNACFCTAQCWAPFAGRHPPAVWWSGATTKEADLQLTPPPKGPVPHGARLQRSAEASYHYHACVSKSPSSSAEQTPCVTRAIGPIPQVCTGAPCFVHLPWGLALFPPQVSPAYSPPSGQQNSTSHNQKPVARQSSLTRSQQNSS